MASKKTQRQLADEAFRRSEQMRLGESHTDAPLPSVRDLPKLDSIPSACPECRVVWTDAAGAVPVIRKDQRQTVFLEEIQCGGCGNSFLVETHDHEELRRRRQAYTDLMHARRAPLPKDTTGRRTRGAG